MKFGIGKKINLIFFIGVQVVALSIGFYLYFRYVSSLIESSEKTLIHSILVVDEIINKEEILQVNKEIIQTEKYYQSWKKVYNLSKIFNLKYFYIVKYTQDEKFLFLLDTGDHPFIEVRLDSNQKPFPVYSESTPEKIKKIPIQEEYPEIQNELGSENLLTIYDDAPNVAYEAFKNEKVYYEEYTDKFGNFKSAFYPMFYSGKKVGLYGADFDITYVRQLERKAQYNLLGAILVGFLMSLIVRYVVNKMIVGKILVLNENSKKIASGDFDIRINIKQKDEIGELAHSFNTMAANLKASFLQIKEYNELLEEKVKQRTQELSETLDKVQELKRQQDGDYFLTSLLINPLMQNRTKSEKVKIQFFIDQKKKFIFRNKEHFIGGDACISGDLELKGKKYCMFFNGDAMGKSMQGAGGVLVIGSIINSIMARSVANKHNLNMTAEEWLLETFYETNRVMEAFEGSMFVSCVMGLVEEETGRMVYFNAEHPFTILYRDGKASFIETTISAHKIGLKGNEVRLFHFKLRLGDVVICGSDGKDDLLICAENGIRQINEDESLILGFVEKAKGDLKEIYNSLKEYGEFSDDISLVRVSYKENEVEQLEDESSQIEFLNHEIVSLIKSNEYELALQKLQTYPYDNLYKSYYTALCYNRLNKNKEAIEILEKVLENFQNHVKTIRLLGSTHLKLGNKKEAKKYFTKYLNFKPNDQKVLELYKQL